MWGSSSFQNPLSDENHSFKREPPVNVALDQYIGEETSFWQSCGYYFIKICTMEHWFIKPQKETFMIYSLFPVKYGIPIVGSA